MSMTFMHKTIKELFPNYIILIKVGNFNEAYQEDSMIVSYLMGYRIKHNIDTDSCGFPILALNKVLSAFDRKCINYLVVDKAHNYEEVEKQNYKRKNKYNELLDISKEYIENINRIEKIKSFLMLHNNRIIEVEKVLYE